MKRSAKPPFAAVLAAYSFTLPAAAQAPNFPQNMPPNTVYGRSAISTGPGQAIPFSVIIQTLNNTANTWTQIQSFIGGNAAAITADGAQVVVQNSSVTQSSIYTPITGGAVYDGARSTVYIPPGSTVLSGNAFSAYVRNRSGNSSALGNGVLFYGLATCGANNTSCWGSNPRVSDTEDNASHGITGAQLIGSEVDYGIRETATIVQGISLLGAAGNVQPAGADGFTCGQLSFPAGTARWIHCLVVPDNSATIGAFFGRLNSGSGTNISSVPIQFAVDTSDSVGHGVNISALPSGVHPALSVLDAVSANGLIFRMANTGNPVQIFAQGSDTNIGFLIAAKGSGTITLGTGLNVIVGAVSATFSSTLQGAGVYSSADPGGAASTNGLSNQSSTTISSGTGTVKMSSANSANNAVWIKVYAGTTAYWIPGWTTNSP